MTQRHWGAFKKGHFQRPGIHHSGADTSPASGSQDRPRGKRSMTERLRPASGRRPPRVAGALCSPCRCGRRPRTHTRCLCVCTRAQSRRRRRAQARYFHDGLLRTPPAVPPHVTVQPVLTVGGAQEALCEPHSRGADVTLVRGGCLSCRAESRRERPAHRSPRWSMETRF